MCRHPTVAPAVQSRWMNRSSEVNIPAFLQNRLRPLVPRGEQKKRKKEGHGRVISLWDTAVRFPEGPTSNLERVGDLFATCSLQLPSTSDMLR